MHAFRCSIVLLALGCVLQGCTLPSYYRTDIKHRSVQACLRAIEIKSDSKIVEYQTNKPVEVKGKLANGEHFGCYFMMTGTDGGYYQDSWSVTNISPPSPPPSTFNGSDKYIVVEGGYCNVTDDCERGLSCSDNKCIKWRPSKAVSKQTSSASDGFTSYEGQVCSQYTKCATGLSCVNSVCTK
jgi:hypothetical protein